VLSQWTFFAPSISGHWTWIIMSTFYIFCRLIFCNKSWNIDGFQVLCLRLPFLSPYSQFLENLNYCNLKWHLLIVTIRFSLQTPNPYIQQLLDFVIWGLCISMFELMILFKQLHAHANLTKPFILLSLFVFKSPTPVRVTATPTLPASRWSCLVRHMFWIPSFHVAYLPPFQFNLLSFLATCLI
jgi:hypothetical protein